MAPSVWENPQGPYAIIYLKDGLIPINGTFFINEYGILSGPGLLLL